MAISHAILFKWLIWCFKQKHAQDTYQTFWEPSRGQKWTSLFALPSIQEMRQSETFWETQEDWLCQWNKALGTVSTAPEASHALCAAPPQFWWPGWGGAPANRQADTHSPTPAPSPLVCIKRQCLKKESAVLSVWFRPHRQIITFTAAFCISGKRFSTRHRFALKPLVEFSVCCIDL